MKANGRRRWRKWARNRWKSSVRAERLPPIMPSWYYRKRRHELEVLPEIHPKPFHARSLCGMTQGARKRLFRAEMLLVDQPYEEDAGNLARKYRIGERLRPCPGCEKCKLSPVRFDRLPRGWSIIIQDEAGQRYATMSKTLARPVSGVPGDWLSTDGSTACFEGRDRVWIIDTGPRACDGSGVLPARKARR